MEAVEQSNEISDGYAAIYEAEMADKENARYESRVDAKGKEEVIVYETTQKSVSCVLTGNLPMENVCFTYITNPGRGVTEVILRQTQESWICMLMK